MATLGSKVGLAGVAVFDTTFSHLGCVWSLDLIFECGRVGFLYSCSAESLCRKGGYFPEYGLSLMQFIRV